MKISVIRCLFFIFCVQLLITSTLSVENKQLSSSWENNLVDHGATTVADIDPQEDGGKAPTDHAVKNMIVNSKKSQGKTGSGGGNNAVHGDNKKSAASTLPKSLSFYISVCFTFTLLVLSF